ncbi:unannotated protein [freshwater metagenome]|uniref:Unannotated protein n=1 Tax=freshwater metagenome TaxID=449393 RepID=A0A6J6PSC4_9ZZZZ
MTLDEAGDNRLQFFFGGHVGGVAELLETIGQARIGEHHAEALQIAVEATLVRCNAHGFDEIGVFVAQVADALDRSGVVFGEAGE